MSEAAPANRTHEVLYESEAALRLVDHELLRLHDVDAALGGDSAADDSGDHADSALIFERAHVQIYAIMARLDEERAASLEHPERTSLPLGHAALFDELEQRMIVLASLFGADRPPLANDAGRGAAAATPR